MKKLTKKLVSLLLAAISVSATALPTGACGEQPNDPKTAPLTFGINALDGNFNPFFTTTESDATIVAQTQISMLTLDASGKPVCGKNQPTAALSYKETMKKGEAVTTTASEATSTEYEFVIKRDIKFSDGTPLTINDVLFNLYVYLDPMYTGSATVDCAKIQGLNAYRLQDPLASDDQDIHEGEAGFYAKADARITNLFNYLSDKTNFPLTNEIQADIALTKKLFREEVARKWTANVGTLGNYVEQYRFTQDWEVFFFATGVVELQYANTADSTSPRTDEQGKYYTSLDADESGNVKEQALIDEMNAPITADERAQAQANDCTTESEIKEYVNKTRAINVVVRENTLDSQIENVLTRWETGNALREEIASDARSAYFKEFKQTHEGLLVKTITGITTGTKVVDDEPHDVLKITINGVDSTTISNFTFFVAPMHYYAGETYAAKANGVDNFGVEFGDKEFFETVLQDPAKNALPIGAGAYQASDENGKTTDVDGDDFYHDGCVYLTRNDYFYTVGSNLSNAKIKDIQYKVVPADQILSALINNEIQVGSPSANLTNISTVDGYEDLQRITYTSNTYGYVGINPKAVPDIEVRQAIMKAMDTASIVKDYYTTDLAETIYRPMSIECWAYPKIDEDTYIGRHEKVKFSRDVEEICALVETAGYRRANSDSVYMKDGKPLALVFTIMDDSKDHPAYDMFVDTAEWLNENCGFCITVATDMQAISKLENGDLQVWADTLSSGVDPDLYQSYHRDSKAHNKYLGYEMIFSDITGQFSGEKDLIKRLSTKIEEGRATLDQTTRTFIYAQALDLIMELCVELPTYQKKDMIVYNKKLINSSTINARNASSTLGVFDRIWEVNFR